jgi:hypothetical protein
VTRRVVAVLVAPGQGVDPPPDALRLAMVEDVYETVAMLELVEPAVVVAAEDVLRDRVGGLTWPGTPVYVVPAGRGPLAGRALRVLAGPAGPLGPAGNGTAGDAQVTLVTSDAPDLPGLLVGKLHRALGSSELAVLPAAGGGLVAVAARVPLPGWLDLAAGPDLDADDAIDALRAAAPRRTSVSVGPGWHRVRSAADVRHLDPGLEGWDVTRALLGR